MFMLKYKDTYVLKCKRSKVYSVFWLFTLLSKYLFTCIYVYIYN